MKYLLTILLISVSYVFSSAQKFSMSVDAQLSVPQGDYKDVNPDAGFGLRLNLLYRVSKVSPVKFGIEFGLQEKGRATQYFSGYVLGVNDDFKVSATSNIFSLMLLTRFQSPGFGKIKPFVDITAGWNVFFSTVSVERLTYFSDYNSSYSNSTKAHWALAYGAAGGLDIPLSKRDDVGLELKVAYLIGANSRYLSNPYIDGNGNVSFEENNSRTTMLIPQAGVRITIQ
ncbi:MAG: hypothetical protein ABI863_17140 [Ginsengibacter sp.]